MCGKTAALVVCIGDTKKSTAALDGGSKWPQKIFFQLELRLNFVWYTAREFPAMGVGG